MPPGRQQSRDTLTALLWGDTSEAQARQNFRQTLLRLRQALGRAVLLADHDNVAVESRPAPAGSEGSAPEPRPRRDPTPSRSGTWTWPALMRRLFDLDVLARPRCRGRLRVIATVQDPDAVRAILAHIGDSVGRDPPGPQFTPGPFQ